MDQGSLGQPLERVRRRPGNRLPARNTLSTPPPLTPEEVRGWGKYSETSPLYRHLNDLIADDETLLDVLNSMEHLPRQNILFAGVQYLMLRDGGGELAAFYPNLTDSPLPIQGVDGPFRDFVVGNSPALVEIGKTRYTQTNECRRCVALLPALWATGAERFHLVDFGTSAGFNLHLDRYRYRWGATTWGPDSSPVRLDTELRGAPVTPRDIEIVSRTGLDLNPLDPRDADDRRWLEALVWPEHHDRRRRLRAAIEVAVANPVDLIAGEGLASLGDVLERLPGDDEVVVINSFVLNQLSPTDVERYERTLAGARSRRPVHRVSMEWLNPDAEGSDLTSDDGSGPRSVGSAQPHGEWLELYARP